VDGERRKLLENLPGATLRARDGLVGAPDELLEVRLALHARVLVDRHTSSVLSHPVERWTTPLLEGRIVRLEPLAPAHEDALWHASRDARTWRWLSVVQPRTRGEWSQWMSQALQAASDGSEMPFATVSQETGEPIGSTRFLALRPEHRSLEIGWTWLHPSAWSTGANVEAKLLQLRHAFDVLGCRRVEIKTDALNERARGALEALGTTFEGVHRKHMLVRGDENRDSAWYSVVDDEWPAVRSHLERRLSTR
jgi:RimJ/RimL family protein N-acetyltransferase